jgi:hypothetical protein
VFYYLSESETWPEKRGGFWWEWLCKRGTSYLLISVAESSLSPAERRAGSNEFIEITQAEFDTVSTLIKGRVKLVEVNKIDDKY